jgi:hypothetical protein
LQAAVLGLRHLPLEVGQRDDRQAGEQEEGPGLSRWKSMPVNIKIAGMAAKPNIVPIVMTISLAARLSLVAYAASPVRARLLPNGPWCLL